MKKLLESRDSAKKLLIIQFGFDTAEGEVWFTIPKTTRYTFKKSEYDTQRAVEFAGAVFIKQIAAEIKK